MMSLGQLNFKGQNKVEVAIKILQICEPPEGYYLADSGGKDSSVCLDLCKRAGVKFDAHYCVSPIDPPQIYKFLKEHHPETQWDYHARGFWKMVVKKALPMRKSRWCCEVIKEGGGEGRVVVVGNRRAESNRRSRQCFIEEWGKGDKVLIRPIIAFENHDVWEYIHKYNVPYCSLYDEGFDRLGCVLCPFERDISRSEQYFPKIVKNWKRSCDQIVERHKELKYIKRNGEPMKLQFQTGEELYQWWVSRK